MKSIKLLIPKINPLIIIFPVFIPIITIIFTSCLVGLLDNFLLLVFKITNSSYEQYSSITNFITSMIPLGYGFFPIHLLISYFFYPLHKTWIKNIETRRITSWIIFLWWFLSGLIISLLSVGPFYWGFGLNEITKKLL